MSRRIELPGRTAALSRLQLAVVAVFPATVVFLATFIHPPRLDASTAETWRNLHFALTFVFPLIALAPWAIARATGRWWGRVAALCGYGFATAYTGLDLLAGVGGGALVLAGDRDATGAVFAMARILERIGGISIIAACAVAAIAAVRLVRWRALPGAIVVIVGAVLLLLFHIYPGRGTLATGVLAIGFALLVIAISSRVDTSRRTATQFA